MTREFGWETHDGRRLKIDEIGDQHLANIIRWVQLPPGPVKICDTTGIRPVYPAYVLDRMKEEAQKRGLGDPFLSAAPYQHKCN